MPPIRRPMRAPAPVAKDGPRINDEIRTREVHLIAADGANLGNVPIAEALAKAQEAGLDLVEISPNAEPPVCKLLDFGKYKYQEQKKQAEARKRQKVVDFFSSLVTRRVATRYTAADGRGRIFHVHGRGLYATIDEANNRNRKPVTLARAIERQPSEAFEPVPFLDLLTAYGSPWGLREGG